MTRYIIIENEWFALENLKKTIQTIRPEWQCVFTAESVAATVKYFRESPDAADLAFMDIDLMDGNCFEIFTQVKVEIPIVFTTAYSDYAIKAFEVNSLDYILKPTRNNAVQQAIEKFEKRNSLTPKIDYEEITRTLARQRAKRVLVNHGCEYFFINVSEIAYFQSEDKYVFVVTFSGKKHLVDYSNLRTVEEKMDPDLFFRVNRGVIVNINAISRISKFFKGRLKVSITAGELSLSETVSSERREDFLNWLGKN